MANLLDPGVHRTLGATRGKTLAASKPLSIPAKLGIIGRKGIFGFNDALDVTYSALEPEETVAPEPILAQQSPDVAQVQTQGADLSPGGGSGDTGIGIGASGGGGAGTGSGDAGSTDGSTGVAGPGNGSSDGTAF